MLIDDFCIVTDFAVWNWLILHYWNQWRQSCSQF